MIGLQILSLCCSISVQNKNKFESEFKKNDKTKIIDYVDTKLIEINKFIEELSISQGQVEKEIMRLLNGGKSHRKHLKQSLNSNKLWNTDHIKFNPEMLSQRSSALSINTDRSVKPKRKHSKRGSISKKSDSSSKKSKRSSTLKPDSAEIYKEQALNSFQKSSISSKDKIDNLADKNGSSSEHLNEVLELDDEDKASTDLNLIKHGRSRLDGDSSPNKISLLDIVQETKLMYDQNTMLDRNTFKQPINITDLSSSKTMIGCINESEKHIELKPSLFSNQINIGKEENKHPNSQVDVVHQKDRGANNSEGFDFKITQIENQSLGSNEEEGEESESSLSRSLEGPEFKNRMSYGRFSQNLGIESILEQLPPIPKMEEIESKINSSLEILKKEVEIIKQELTSSKENFGNKLIEFEIRNKSKLAEACNSIDEVRIIIEQKQSGILDRIMEERKTRQRDINDINFSINNSKDNFEEKYAEVVAIHTSYQESMTNLGEVSAAIIEIMNLNSIMDAYDEEDKRSISLWGTHEKQINLNNSNTRGSLNHRNFPQKKTLQSGITIDKKCQSCTNHNPSVLSAFKMACLAYFPSEVSFKGKFYKRAYLHEQKLEGIKRLHKSILLMPPWSSMQISNQKYLNINYENSIKPINGKQEECVMTDFKILQDGVHEIEDDYTEKHIRSMKSLRPISRGTNQAFNSKSRKQNIDIGESVRQENTNEYSSIHETSSMKKTVNRLQSSKAPRDLDVLEQNNLSIEKQLKTKNDSQSIKNLKKIITLKKLGAPSSSYSKKRKQMNSLICNSSLSVRSHQNSIERHAITQKNCNSNMLLKAFYHHQP